MRALAMVFGHTEQFIVYGSSHLRVAEPAASYSTDSPEITRLIKSFTWLTDEQRKETLKDLESKATANRAIAKELGTRFEFKTDHEVARHLKPVPKVVKRR